MSDSILLGFRHYMITVPRLIWKIPISRQTKKFEAELAFMSAEHHLVRNFVVRELPRSGESISEERIADELKLSINRLRFILDDLEKHMTFICRDSDRAINWAYPVTVEKTPHSITYDTGEQGYAAWAQDSIAIPFVQGHLRQKPVSVVIKSQCAHCDRPITIDSDSELSYRVAEEGADPLVFLPIVNFDKLKDPCIIDAFWRKNVFFWSEEHAREHRRKIGGVLGIYLTLRQTTYIARTFQSALFAFPKHTE